MLRQVRYYTDLIVSFLSQKALYEGRKQDFTNRTKLADVEFWFQLDNATGNVILAYSKHPTEWDYEKMMRDMDEQESVFHLDQSGVLHWRW
jgi:hypothetical protein